MAETRIRGSPIRSARRRSEAAYPPLAHREVVDLDEANGGDRGDHELGDPHTRLHGEGALAIRVVQDDAQLAPIPGVDEPGRVHDADPVARREPGSRQHESGVARRYLDGEPGRDDRPSAG